MWDEQTLKIIIAILGFGWLSTGYALWKDRNTTKQEVRKYLMEKRQNLYDDPDLLLTIKFLKEERAKPQDKPPFSYPKGFDGDKLRALPGFLEPIGIYLEFSNLKPKDAYDIFAKEVMLCHRSKIL